MIIPSKSPLGCRNTADPFDRHVRTIPYSPYPQRSLLIGTIIVSAALSVITASDSDESMAQWRPTLSQILLTAPRPLAPEPYNAFRAIHWHSHVRRQNYARAAVQVPDGWIPSRPTRASPTGSEPHPSSGTSTSFTDARCAAQATFRVIRCAERSSHAYCKTRAATAFQGQRHSMGSSAMAVLASGDAAQPTSAIRKTYPLHSLPFCSLARRLRWRGIKVGLARPSHPQLKSHSSLQSPLHFSPRWRGSSRCSPTLPSSSPPRRMQALGPRRISPFPMRTSLPMASLVLPSWSMVSSPGPSLQATRSAMFAHSYSFTYSLTLWSYSSTG